MGNLNANMLMTSTFVETSAFFIRRIIFMIASLGLILFLGFVSGGIFKNFKLPSIVGMILLGILIGPYELNLIDSNILSMSADIRKMALIVILLKAGLSLDIDDLKKAGKPALLLSFIPASFEIVGFFIFAPIILGIRRVDALVMGSVMAAVSPAVVVPRMISLIEKGYGKKKAIPQMIMAGASCDDIFVIVLFTSFLSMAKGEKFKVFDLINIPLSIISGVIVGLLAGYIVVYFLKKLSNIEKLQNAGKILIIISTSFLLMGLEKVLETIMPMSGLLGVVSMALIIKIKSHETISKNLAKNLGVIWTYAEIFLFVLVGAAINISYAFEAGFAALVIIAVGLIFRTVGLLLAISSEKFTIKQRIFCIIAYLPKATVQAAIGSVPLASGLGCGQIVLTIAVVGILVTAPIGALGIDLSYKKLLDEK